MFVFKTLANATYATVKDESYKVFSLFRKCKKAYNEIAEQQKELIAKYNVPHLKDAEGKELMVLDTNAKEYAPYIKVYNEMMEDESGIEYKRLSPDAFFALCQENKFPASIIDELSEFLLMEEGK